MQRRFLWASLGLFTMALHAAAPADVARDFSRAEKLLSAGQEKQALLSYHDFLRRYPKDARAVDAQYAVGEIHFQRREWEQALSEYRKVFALGINNSARQADATYRIGEVLYRTKKVDEARIEWEAVLRKFPRTDAARRAQLGLGYLPKKNEVKP